MIRIFSAWVAVSKWSESEHEYIILSDSIDGVLKQLKRRFDDISYRVHKPGHVRQLVQVTVCETSFDEYNILRIDYSKKDTFEI